MHGLAALVMGVLAGDSKAAEGDDAEPGGVERRAVIATDEGDTAVIAAFVVRDLIEHGRILGRHRLTLDTDLFAWQRRLPWSDAAEDGEGLGEDVIGDGDADAAIDAFGFLGGAPVFGSVGAGPTGNIALTYGYGLSESVVLGARVGLGVQRLTTPVDDGLAETLIAYHLTPFFHYAFRSGHRIRPFIGLRAGFGGAVAQRDAPEERKRSATIGPTFGANFGVHNFVTERVSLDLMLAGDASLVWRRAHLETEALVADQDFARIAVLPRLSLVVGLTVWLGRDRHLRDRT